MRPPVKRSGVLLVAASAAGLAASVVVLPPLGDEEVRPDEQALAYLLVLLPVGALFYRLLALAGPVATRRILLLASLADAALTDLLGATAA